MAIVQPDERTWHFKQLRSSVEQLVASGSGQKPLFPDLAVTADELALNFDHWATLVREEYDGELTDAQRTSLAALEETFARMSRDAADFDADVWTETALKTSEHWASVRRLAIAALDAFGWAAEDVPADAADLGTEFTR